MPNRFFIVPAIVCVMLASCSPKPAAPPDSNSSNNAEVAQIPADPVPVAAEPPAPIRPPVSAGAIAKLLATATYHPDDLPELTENYTEAERTYVASCANRILAGHLGLAGEEGKLQSEIDDKMRSVDPGYRSQATPDANTGIILDSSLLSLAVTDPAQLPNNQLYQRKVAARKILENMAPYMKANMGLNLIPLLEEVRALEEKMYESIVNRTCVS
jgi:hypothetical protein